MPQPRHAAAALIRHYAYDNDPDQRTSMADSRIALNIARGVALDDIDPANGYDYSRAAYKNVRDSWVWNIKQHGYSEIYEGDALRRAIANWTARRPDLIAGDDWLAAATAAHHAHWAGLNRPCPSESCDLHAVEEDVTEAMEADQGVQESLFADHPAALATASIPLPCRQLITDLQLPV
jgi:hypothetical protein